LVPPKEIGGVSSAKEFDVALCRVVAAKHPEVAGHSGAEIARFALAFAAGRTKHEALKCFDLDMVTQVRMGHDWAKIARALKLPGPEN
jgi:hypothetical protein